MASTNQSSVLVEQPSSPPSHPYTSPDFALSVLSPTSSAQRTAPTDSTNMPQPEVEQATPQEESQQQSQQQIQQNPEEPSESRTTDAQASASETANDGDDSSNSGSNADSSTSTETSDTTSTPRSSAHDGGHPIPDSSSAQLEGENPGQSATENNTAAENPSENSSPEADPSNENPSIPPPPVNPEIPIPESIPSWVMYEEDTSSPDEQELKVIEANKNELNAANTEAVEREVFTDLEDPDLRPCKKIRLSWIVKGVRGNKDRPNRARIMTSPAVCIDGNFWNLKLFPRGNKSRNHLAIYLRCSPAEPLQSEESLEGSFKCYEGTPDVDLSKVEPSFSLEMKKPDVKEEEPAPPNPEPVKEADEGDRDDQSRDDRDDDDSVSGDEGDRPDSSASVITVDDYRVSAQVGLVIYNPAEPRTCYTSSISHQFYPYQDDWGNETAVNQWEDIHRRRHGQRQALLRDDTLAIDAYIRIYDDPTKALFWHSSPGESQWDSKGLAGFFPVGTRLLTHSPATAGIIAWMLLAPFRAVIQKIDAGLWRKDSWARPRPLIAYLQLMLFQMRNMKKEELYVRLDNVISEMKIAGESFDNVKTFWEAFRRSIEIETDGDDQTHQALREILGTRQFIRELPNLPIQDVENFQQSATVAFEKSQFKGSLPNFLPLTLQRQSFDADKRQWQLHLDRVRISEELDLTKFCTDEDGKYTLYGFIIHDGDRTSGRFFSLLRPTGPGGKWLAFSDGDGNKVFSYTRKQVEQYEGLEGAELKKPPHTRQVIHSALYIRTSCLSEYLYDQLEPYHLPFWLKSHLDENCNQSADLFGEPEETDKDKSISVELFWDRSVGGQEGKLDLYKLKSNDKARQKQYRQVFTADRETSITDIKTKMASILEVDQKAFKLWAMNYHRLGAVSKGYMQVLPGDSMVKSCMYTGLHLCLWFTMVPQTYEVADDVLEQNFMKLEGEYIKATPKPEPPKVDEVQPVSATSQTGLESNDANIPSSDDSAETVNADGQTAAPDAEQASVQEAVERSLEGLPNTETNPVTSTSDVAEADQNGTTLSSEVEIAAAPDAEQSSVREAVNGDVQAMSSRSSTPVAHVTEVEPSENASQDQASVSGDAVVAQPESAAEGQDPTISANGTEPNGAPSSTTADADVATEPVVASQLSADPAENLPITPSEPALVVIPQDITFNNTGEVNGENDELPPVVHGHLFEASSHGGPPLSPTESRSEAPLTHGEPPLPIGIPIAVGNEQIILVQPTSEDISPEDAALISSMIAADLEAAERRERTGANVEIVDEEADSGVEDQVTESRPLTPRQNIPLIYGFLHVFDADNQKFTAHGTFMVPRNTMISAMVRQQMGYDEDKSFHLWKRDGTYRTVGVSLESSFQDASMNDCCEVVVGDHLGESKMEALKAEAKYVDPGQLMRYLAMVQRGHPVTASTSEGPVEIAEFGGDYYRGSLVRGQRHGKESCVITQSGDKYEGPLLAGQKSGGKGKMVYQNGDLYDGEWLDDQKHGQGEFVEKRTGNRYVGGYENDKRWGKGITYWEQADQQAALCQVCYFEEVDALFYKCGHVVACYACAKQCHSDSSGCPVCRKPIEAVVKMYRS